ncbi:MAG: hypothetical protein KA436_06530 [Oligoflexales bacterium]|nr:hypothetical protein [Oligoflexales bacterium]
MKLRSQIKRYVSLLQFFVDRIWYPPLIALLAALDNFIIVIPNDGILISSCMLTPKRWFILALCVTVGSTIGSVGLAMLIEFQGLPWMLDFFPGADQSKIWQLTNEFFQRYGLIIVFVVAVTPIMQQPAIILASLANTPLLILGSVVFLGRFIKFLIMAYVGSHTPRLLQHMWGLKGDLADVDIKIK